MVDPNTRQGKRTPVTLKIKFKSETLEQFIERYAVDVSQGGIFIRTKEPLAVGTQMRFEFQLRDASPLIAGEGTVVWTRENDPSRPAIAPGMGVRFDKLAEGSQGVLEKILTEKAKQAPSRPSNESPTKPPMFTDTPTVVAPLPVQEALLGNDSTASGARKRPDSGKTPLPKPIPFHSDADEFPEEAFEEATKVRALDELIAATAGSEGESLSSEQTVLGKVPEPDEEDLAQRARTAQTVSDRADTKQDRAETKTGGEEEPPPDRESAPLLPSPPVHGSAPRLLDTTPSPRTDEPSTPALGVPGEIPKTRPGVEPAKAVTRPSGTTKPPAGAKDPVAKPAAEPPEKKLPLAPEPKSSMAPMIIMLLLLVAAGGAAVWFFVLRPKAEEANKNGGGAVAKPTNNGSAAPTPIANTNGGSNTDTPPTNNGSAGSATEPVANNGSAGSATEPVANNGNAGSAGSATEPMTTNGSADMPAAPQIVDTYVGSSVSGATVEILGTRFKGNAPLRAKLEKGKAYQARVSALGYVAQELSFKGGDYRPTAKLQPKPRSITINSEPAGALIFVDNANSGFTTPYTLDLKGSQLTKRSVRITLRKNGFKTLEKAVDISAFKDEGDKMSAAINETLSVPAATPPSGSGNGSDATSPAGGGGGDEPTGDGPKEPTSNAPAPKEPEPEFAQ
ncbi:MAG: TIGR02266 family protein [Kofleriaceae bacterium]|nr:TIGR02266 family protein [Kofleriaceae bacterium]